MPDMVFCVHIAESFCADCGMYECQTLEETDPQCLHLRIRPWPYKDVANVRMKDLRPRA